MTCWGNYWGSSPTPSKSVSREVFDNSQNIIRAHESEIKRLNSIKSQLETDIAYLKLKDFDTTKNINTLGKLLFKLSEKYGDDLLNGITFQMFTKEHFYKWLEQFKDK